MAGSKYNEEDFVGKVFGRLTILGLIKRRHSAVYATCQCACGNKTESAILAVLKGQTVSCGCNRAEAFVRRNTKHGHATNSKTSRLYTRWEGMKQRTNNPNHKAYKNYGARGIKLCDEWSQEDGFSNFMKWAYSKYPYIDTLLLMGYWIERKDNDKGYSPDNCTFCLPSDNLRNRRPRGRNKPKKEN